MILIERFERDGIDAVTAYFLVAANDEKELRKVLKRYPLDGVKITPSAYDCTGRFFCDPAEIRKICDGRFFVKINGYYDV
ncbi:hypothetical protein GCM10010965_14450 [Caldalkalibacillus thermarum]|uniref:hypothetical protein n=1 Tax=Caldalkalibacillus thermarum TaxID=296745 RepID=UPI00166321EA|nr:hypothetical protein [Caldalkalibacillus thermarum]GGK22664.1 hypothetical protein GCM10010965_14450 [Caldalkalibacillus thermarum]